MIEVRNLTKVYAEHRAVGDLSFTAPAGQVTGFLGPNGAGKTTTLRCLLGLARPMTGEALIDGRRYPELHEPRRHVGAVLESTGFHPSRSGRDHLRVIARAGRLGESRIDALIDVVGLTSAARRPVGSYSLGMRQRLGLAAAMLGDPPTVVLDEPSNGLDPEGVAWVRRLLRSWADEGRTVLVSSHLLAEVAQVVDRVVIVAAGRLVSETDVAELTSGRILVRADDLEALCAALRRAGIDFEALGDGALAVSSGDPAAVGALARDAGVTLSELNRQSAGERLESMFLAATGGAP